MPRPASLVDLLNDQAQHFADRTVLSFVPDEASLDDARSLTYGELHDRSTRVAGWLREHLPARSRVLLLYPPGVEFAVAYFGSLYAAMVPVPAPLPANPAQLTRTSGIAASCGAAMVLTDSANIADVSAWLAGSGLDGVGCAATPDHEAASRQYSTAAGWSPPAVDPDGLAFLQFTSGSTSEPRGVMLSHRNVLENLELARRTFQLPPGLRTGGWLPQYHDMGLVATLLMPIFLGGHASLISAASFLRRPHRWLELIDRHDVALSPAPNFAYDLCVRRVSADRVARLDLSRWRYACNGAEPIQARTLRSFAEHFAPAGLRPQALCPCYGMAETVVFVAGDRPDRTPVVRRVHPELLEQNQFVITAGGRAMVSSGPRPTGLLIVDPESGKPLADGQVGEIWLRGPSVAQGYWGQPEPSERTFGARTAGGEGPFLRTGDLGACHDGELFVTGRIKELIIVHGRNVYPQDIEHEVASLHPRFAENRCAAFHLPGEERDPIVVVQELAGNARPSAELVRNAPPAVEYAQLAAVIKSGLSRELGLAVGNVLFVRVGAIGRSTSGKIQRVLLRERFINRTLRPIFADLEPDIERRYRPADEPPAPAPAPLDPARQAIADELFRLATRAVGLDQAGQAELRPRFTALRLNELGLDSLTAVRLRYHILSELGVNLTPQQLIGGSTVADLVELVHQQALLRQLTLLAPGDREHTGEVEEFTL